MGSIFPAVLACLVCSACYPDAGSFPRYDAGQGNSGSRDLSFHSEPLDGSEGHWNNFDFAQEPDPCGDSVSDPHCQAKVFEAPFALQKDPLPERPQRDHGVTRDDAGYLRLAGLETNGIYQVLVGGCRDGGKGPYIDTMWFAVNWEGDRPPGTFILARAQSGNWMDIDDPAWQGALWSMADAISPLDLQATLTPNLTPQDPGQIVNDAMLRVEVQLQSLTAGKTPSLKRFEIAFKCYGPPGG